MYTVLIAEKSVLQSIKENSLFFSEYLKTKQIGFCEWDTQSQNPADAVPNLTSLISKHTRWRAVVITGKDTISERNPFDVVGYKDDIDQMPKRDRDESYGEYLDRRREYLVKRRNERLDAYRQGARQPLARLATYLCEAPLSTGGINHISQRAERVQKTLNSIAAQDGENRELDKVFADVRGDYDEFAEYQEEMRFKEALRSEMLEGIVRNFTQPAEVLCIARRCYDEGQNALNAAWIPHNEAEYSSFYKYNMYFDRMRYLICDVLPEHHLSYNQSYLEFLFTILVVACNELPQGCLQPNRVFRLECQPEPDTLSRVLSAYHGKLEATVAVLSQKVFQNKGDDPEELTDRECEARFQEQVDINMPTMESFEMSSLYLKNKELGLAYDCPENETNKWHRERRSTQDALGRYLKRPARALKLAAEDMRVMSDVDVTDANRMNSFQVEGVERFVADAEMQMASAQTAHLEDVATYRKRFEEPGQEIEKANKTRLPKKPAIILGCCLVFIYLLGFLPFVFANISSVGALVGTLVFCGVAAAVICVALILCLVVTKLIYAKKWRRYNQEMHGVVDEINEYLDGYSQYLGAACAAIRGHRVLNYIRCYEEPYNSTTRILKKHMAQIIERRSEIEDLFGDLIDTRLGAKEEPFDYDFQRPSCYEYPLFVPGKADCSMEFMQPGETVQVPLLLVKSMKAVREELYD